VNDGFDSQGLRFEMTTPGKAIRITYAGSVAHIATPTRLPFGPRRVLKGSPAEECEIDISWEANCPMFAIAESGAGSPGGSVVATDHYEQFGRWSGSVRVGSHGWTLDDVTGWRDHSWGPREWASYYGETLMMYTADGMSVMAYSEQDENGSRSVTGSASIGGELRPVINFETFSDYSGGPRFNGRYQAVLQIEGAPVMPLDGTIRHFVPLTMGEGDRGVRVAQLVVDFVGRDGAWGNAEFLRPMGG
jgi:hypothetical protein